MKLDNLNYSIYLFMKKLLKTQTKKAKKFQPDQISDASKKANELYKHYKEYCEKDHPYEEMDYVL